MVAIGFDEVSGSLIIEGNGSFPARTLVAMTSPLMVGRIQIDDLGGRGEQLVLWSDVTNLDGTFTPASMADALAYLQGEFAKSCPVGETFGVPVVAGADLVQGQPVAISRASGQLLPARADTYTLAFVAGIASTDTAQGFTNRPAHGAVTLPDWTGVTGSPSLAVGQPYFLAPTGGLATVPDFTAACVARVGAAVTPRTLVVEPSDPILL